MLPETAIEQIMHDLDMETCARMAGLNINPPKRWYRCDTCRRKIYSAAKPEDIVGSACGWCDGGSFEIVKEEYNGESKTTA